MEKRVLIFSGSFYPDSTGRAKRMAHRAKYLSKETSWTPIIALPLGEKRTIVEIGGEKIPVYRTNDEDNIGQTSVENKNKSRIKDIKSIIKNSIYNPTYMHENNRGDLDQKIVGAFKRYFTTVPFPDPYSPYLPALVYKTSKIISEEEIDLLNTICYPYTYHILGNILKLVIDIPWLAEFQDPWVTEPMIFDGESGIYNKYLEKKVVESCDTLVYNYGIQVPKNYFVSTYPKNAHKVEIIDCPGATGVDFEEIPENVNKNRDFTITYGGSFYGEDHTPEPFLNGFSEFASRREFDRDPQVNFYGDWRKDFDDTVSRLDLEPYVNTHGWIDPQEFSKQVQKSHVALFIVRPYEGDELNVPQKIVEYAAAETPILALCDDDWEVAEFIRKNNIGVVADPNDPADISKKLDFLFENFQNGSLTHHTPEDELLKQMDAKRLAIEYGKILDETAENAQ